MVLKSREKSLTRVWDFKENSQVIQELPQDNLLRRVALHLDLVLQTPAGAAIAVGIKNSDILNIIKRIEVIIDGNDNILDCDLRTFFEALRFSYGTAAYKDTVAIPAAGTSSTYHVEIPLDFAFDPKLISDVSALLLANLYGSLDLRITWGSISDIFTTPNGTIVNASSKVRVSVIEIYENGNGESGYEAAISGNTKIYQGVQEDQLTGAHDSYPANEFPVQVRPVAAVHLQTIFCCLKNVTDGDPAYANDVITQLKLENVKGGGEAIFHGFFADLQRTQKTDYGFETDNPIGRLMVDYADNRFGGLVNNDPDALKWKFINLAAAAGKANAIRAFKRYIVTGK